jgi:hypothetical protein
MNSVSGKRLRLMPGPQRRGGPRGSFGRAVTVADGGQRHGFVGARPYLLTEQEARRLAHLLRASVSDHRIDEAAAALRLAWELELRSIGEGLDEPLEISWPEAESVIQALPEVTAHAYVGLEALLQAARRLADAG